MAMSKACLTISHVCDLLKTGKQDNKTGDSVLWEDNQSAPKTTRSKQTKPRTKHVDGTYRHHVTHFLILEDGGNKIEHRYIEYCQEESGIGEDSNHI